MSDPQFIILIGALILIADACAQSDSNFGVLLFLISCVLLLGGSFWWLFS